MNPFRAPSNLSHLRELLGRSSRSSSLAEVPSNLEKVINAYESSDLHPGYREDIYQILNTSISLAAALSERTNSIKPAIASATGLLAILGRIINHLNNSPSLEGFGILLPGSNQLHEGFFSSSDEAEKKLEALHRLGLAEAAQVVPVRVDSGTVTRPEAAPLVAPLPGGPASISELTAKLEPLMAPQGIPEGSPLNVIPTRDLHLHDEPPAT